MTTDERLLDPRFLAGVDLLKRTGSRDFRIGWSPEEDGEPTVWYVVATWDHPQVGTGAETMSALDPTTAVLRLCEKAVEGGRCAHCGKLTIFVADSAVNDGRTRLDRCAYVWDVDSVTFRRGCA